MYEMLIGYPPFCSVSFKYQIKFTKHFRKLHKKPTEKSAIGSKLLSFLLKSLYLLKPKLQLNVFVVRLKSEWVMNRVLKKSKAPLSSNVWIGNIFGILQSKNLKPIMFSELPSPIRVEIRGIDDTSNFDDFGDSEMIIRKSQKR